MVHADVHSVHFQQGISHWLSRREYLVAICSSCVVGLYPLWEGRHSVANTFRGIARDLSRKGKATTKGRVIEGIEGPTSPVEESKKMPVVMTKKEE